MIQYPYPETDDALRTLILEQAEQDSYRVHENFEVMEEADFKDLANESWWYNCLGTLEGRYESRFEELQNRIDRMQLAQEYRNRFLDKLHERLESQRKPPHTGI